MPITPERRDNSITFLRLALALGVVLGHSFILGAFGAGPLGPGTNTLISLQQLAVLGFFSLSGFLLRQSLELHPSLGRFVVRRLARIFPGFWVSLAVTTFVVAPAMFAILCPVPIRYGASLRFGHQTAIGYFVHNMPLWISQRVIDPLFFGNPSHEVNGSLWTLSFEAFCYLTLAVAWSLGLVQRRAVVLSVFILGSLASAIQTFAPIPFWKLPGPWMAIINVGFHPGGSGVILAFVAGVALYSLRGGEPLWHPWWFTAALAIFAISLPLGAVRAVWPVTLPYLLLCLGERLPFQKLDRVGDFSYGVYIYSFLVQQCLTALGWNRDGFWSYFAASALFSIGAGAVSWYLVEKPAIQFAARLTARWNRAPNQNPVPLAPRELSPL